MASNIQRGPRRLDAGDWVRLKRLGGAKNYLVQQPQDVINPPPRLETETGRRVFTEFGTSKTRRPASNWIDFVASQTVDYVLESQAGTCGPSKQLTINKVCNCDTRNAVKHNGLCITCIYDPIVVRHNNPVVGPVLNSFTIPADYCAGAANINVVAGTTYTVTNNSSTNDFNLTDGFLVQVVTIPFGLSTFTASLTGALSCPVLNSFTIPADYCASAPNINVVAGTTYTVTNNSSQTEFYVYAPGSNQQIIIPAGPSTTLVNIVLTGLFSCPV